MEDLLNQTNTSITYTLKSDAIHLVIPAFVVNFIGAHLNTLIKCINLYFVDQYLFILVVLYTCTYTLMVILASEIFFTRKGREEGTILFNDAFNIFCLQLASDIW